MWGREWGGRLNRVPPPSMLNRVCSFCGGLQEQQLLVKPFLSQQRPPHHSPFSPEMANQGNNAAVAKREILTRMNRKT